MVWTIVRAADAVPTDIHEPRCRSSTTQLLSSTERLEATKKPVSDTVLGSQPLGAHFYGDDDAALGPFRFYGTEQLPRYNSVE